MSILKEIIPPRGYLVTLPTGCSRFSRELFALMAAEAASEEDGEPIDVIREALIKDGQEVEGEATICRYVDGRQVFPFTSHHTTHARHMPHGLDIDLRVDHRIG